MGSSVRNPNNCPAKRWQYNNRQNGVLTRPAGFLKCGIHGDITAG